MPGRKPLHLARRGILTPRERLWDAIRKLSRKGDGTFTLDQVQDTARPLVDFAYARWYRNALVAGGYLEPQSKVKFGQAFTAMRYRLVKDQLDAPRLTQDGKPTQEGSGLTAMWRAMQVLKVFDYTDVQRAASVPGFEVRLASAKSFVLELARTNFYLRVVEEAKPGKPARYRLVKDTGMHPPAVCKRHVVFDRNLGRVAWQESDQEVVDGIR